MQRWCLGVRGEQVAIGLQPVLKDTGKRKMHHNAEGFDLPGQRSALETRDHFTEGTDGFIL